MIQTTINQLLNSIIILISIAGSSLAFATEKGSAELTVIVTGVKHAEGKISITLVKQAQDWLKSTDNVVHRYVPVNQHQVTTTFEQIPSGIYAVSVYHDENSNGHIDLRAFSIPKEGYGFSGNADTIFGPPDFNEASFEFTGTPEEIRIIMNY